MLSRNRTTPNHLDLNNKDNPNNKKKVLWEAYDRCKAEYLCLVEETAPVTEYTTASPLHSVLRTITHQNI